MNSLPLVLILVPTLILVSALIFLTTRYKRCPSNAALVIYGKTSGGGSAKVIHGGGALVWPLIQDFAYLSLSPMAIEIDLKGALSSNNIRVNVPSTFTVAVSKDPSHLQNAAERLLGMRREDIAEAARDIIFGQLRLSIASMTIEEINQDRDKFLDLINRNVNEELTNIGITILNVNISDITDESGYIAAIGKKAAAIAINKANIDVAEQEKTGAIGVATADRERLVSVAEQDTQAAAGVAEKERAKAVALSEQESQKVQGQKAAERDQRIRVQALEAEAIEKENASKAQIAEHNATLEVAKAEARRRGEVAEAEANRKIYEQQKMEEVARLEKEEVAQREIDKRKVEIDAAAKAEVARLEASGEADAILARYRAEAEGTKAVLDAKAEGYKNLIAACGDASMAPTLLMIEKLPEIVREQVKAISGIKIDKITVWDSGSNGGKGGTAGFLQSFAGMLPPMHEVAKQAGIQLPDFMGKIGSVDQATEEASGSSRS